MNTRPRMDQLGLSTGKKTRLHRILHEHGLRNGTAVFLPYDHGLEHGPRDFFGHPGASDPRYIIRLAREGGFNGIALQIGLARKFYWEYAGEVPLVLKLNGKTDIPSAVDPLSPVNATVEEAVRPGADAVGYTLYVGSPAQERDFAQYLRVREDAERFGMPLIVWSYPRGAAIAAKGGKDSFYAVDYAARTASELGADRIGERATPAVPARRGEHAAGGIDVICVAPVEPEFIQRVGVAFGPAPVSMAGARGAATRREPRASACRSGQAQEIAVRPRQRGSLPRRPAGAWRRHGQDRDSPACACPPGRRGSP